MKLTSILLLGALSACGTDSIEAHTNPLAQSLDYTTDPTVTRLTTIGTRWQHDIRGVSLISGDRLLLTGTWGSRIVTLDGKEIGPLEGDVADVNRIRAHVGTLANGNILVLWLDNGPPQNPTVVQIHDIDGNVVATLPPPVLGDQQWAAATFDGRHILLVEARQFGEGSVRVLDAETLAETRLLEPPHWIDNVQMLPTGELAVLDHDDDSNSRIVLYDASGAVTAVISGVTKYGRMQVLPNGNLLTVSGPLPFAPADTVRVFDRTGNLLWTDSHAPDDIGQLVVDDRTIMVAHGNSRGTDARVFDHEGRRLARFVLSTWVGDLVLLPTGQLLSFQGGFVADVDGQTPITWHTDHLTSAMVLPETGDLLGLRNTGMRAVYRLDFGAAAEGRDVGPSPRQ